MEAHAHLPCSGDGVIKPRPVGVKIEMVGCERAAGERQFRKADLAETTFPPARNGTRWDKAFSASQRAAHPAHRARRGQALVEMMVGVDQTGGDEAAGRFKDLGALIFRILPQILAQIMTNALMTPPETRISPP